MSNFQGVSLSVLSKLAWVGGKKITEKEYAPLALQEFFVVYRVLGASTILFEIVLAHMNPVR